MSNAVVAQPYVEDEDWDGEQEAAAAPVADEEFGFDEEPDLNGAPAGDVVVEAPAAAPRPAVKVLSLSAAAKIYEGAQKKFDKAEKAHDTVDARLVKAKAAYDATLAEVDLTAPALEAAGAELDIAREQFEAAHAALTSKK